MSLNVEEGFSIIEILVAMLITTLSVGTIMYGVVTLRETTDGLTMKEKAFDELANYTELWKSKIAAGEWTGTNTWTPAKQFNLVDKNNKRPIRATLFKKGSIINSTYPYPLYSLETKITWTDRYGESGIPGRELNFKVYQVEFK